MNEILRTGSQYMNVMKFLTTLSMEPGVERERFIVMEPPLLNLNAEGIYKGFFHSDTILPAKVRETWYPNLPSDNELARGPIILHFHGGPFLFGTGRPADSGFIGDTLAAKLGP